jgi:hypothetical protein
MQPLLKWKMDKYCESVLLALRILRAIACIMLSFVACPTLPYFTVLSHK